MLTRDNGNFFRTITLKPLSRKVKSLPLNLTSFLYIQLIQLLMSFCFKWQFCTVLWLLRKTSQPDWLKYQAVKNITYPVLWRKLWCLIFHSLTFHYRPCWYSKTHRKNSYNGVPILTIMFQHKLLFLDVCVFLLSLLLLLLLLLCIFAFYFIFNTNLH